MKQLSKKIFFLCLAAGLLLGLFIKLFFLDVLKISGTSMEPTLKNGSRVVVCKTCYGLVKPFSGSFFIQWKSPKPDDIVIYLHENKIVVKRCIATGGTHLEFLQNSHYILKINQKEIPLTPVQYQMMKAFQEIPEGYILTIGDNMEDSIDSRDYGFVSVKNITGKILGK